MGYLVQKTRAASLIIGNKDYTKMLIQFAVSDSGAFQKGLITTSGTITLGQRPGKSDIEDYDRNFFKRGRVVTLDIEKPDGTTYRHPRGYLYVISTSYSPENEVLTVEVGCLLTLAYLTENVTNIIDEVPIPLDPAQRTIENCSASFASAGMFMYQNNQGELVTRKFFGNDSSAGIEEGKWVSILGESALAVSPLATSGAIPDRIELSYQVPEGILADDNKDKVDTTVETSNYFLNYPATVWARVPDPTPTGEMQLPDTIKTLPGSPGQPAGSCGQAPTPPQSGGTEVVPGGVTNFYICSDLWSTERQSAYLPATRVATSTTTYGAVAAQVSLQEQVVEGPEIEANPQYFADKFAYCVATYGWACNPQGSCPYVGLDTKVLSKQMTYYEYGEKANELKSTIQDTYETILSAYNTDEWRSGAKNGIPQDFNGNLEADMGLYRRSRVITKYGKKNNVNIQITTTYNSITSRGVGPTSGSSIDALDGIKTTVRRESSTNTTLDVRPDSANSSTTQTEEVASTIRLRTKSFTKPPEEAGYYEIDMSIPVPLLSEDSDEIKGWVEDYERYLVGFVKGDLYGLQIGESMREEIVDGWYPGMPFRYADPGNDTVAAMRMDACAWGVTQDEAVVVTNGIWLGWSSGTLQLGSNLVGNSKPDMTRPAPGAPPAPSPTPPVPPSGPPTIENDVVGQSFDFEVDIDLWLQSYALTYFEDGVYKPNPTDLTGKVEMSLVPYVTGFVVETGGLLEAEGNGNIPLEYGGSLVTENATVVNADLFSD